jgi:hypothetical protein
MVIEEEVIGSTRYDLQTNTSVQTGFMFMMMVPSVQPGHLVLTIRGLLTGEPDTTILMGMPGLRSHQPN